MSSLDVTFQRSDFESHLPKELELTVLFEYRAAEKGLHNRFAQLVTPNYSASVSICKIEHNGVDITNELPLRDQDRLEERILELMEN